MTWAEPEFTRSQVDAAGHILARANCGLVEKESALEVVGNWRAIHAFPLNTFQIGLRSRAASIYPNVLVAQRLKRLPSIEFKLQRYSTMNLSQMQDIGGCRAVLRTSGQVRRLVRHYKESTIKHELIRENDYISMPKPSGYRGWHLVYRYFSDRKDTYNGLLIELQIRSRLQHAWATAVETVGTFLQHSLKSSIGPDEWLRFFAISSSVFARVERQALVPKTPEDYKEARAAMKRIMSKLDVEKKLKAFGRALQVTDIGAPRGSHYFLLSLVPEELTVSSYRIDELDVATKDYLDLERQAKLKPGAQTVLVSAASLKSLRRAYPNYYLDTDVFITQLKMALD